MNQIILGIDIGSTKICSVIAEIKQGIPYIIGTGVHKASGIKKGIITNIEQASSAIRNSVNDAKRVSGEQVNKAIISLSGANTKSIRKSAVINVRDNEIGLGEINRVMQAVIYEAGIPEDSVVIHALPYEFRLDDQSSVEDPMGMSASRMQAFVHIVTVKKSVLENIKRAVRESGIDIENVILSSYASSIAVLSNEEKELGVACIDMGGQTCDLMIYSGYSMRYCDFLKVGSENITVDVATLITTQPEAAERIKIEYGNLTPSDDDKDKAIRVTTIGGEEPSEINLQFVHKAITSRVEECLQYLNKSIDRSGLRDSLGAGIVLTGGMSNLSGMQKFAADIFGKPVKVSKPMHIDGAFNELENAQSATVIGLILHGAGQHTNYEMDFEKKILYKNKKGTMPIEHNSRMEYPTNKNVDVVDNDFLPLQTGEQDKQSGIFARISKWLSQLF